MTTRGAVAAAGCALLVAAAITPLPAAEGLTLARVLERIVATYPSLTVAARQLERARQENARVESQLGWTLGAQAGVARDLSFIGSPTNRLDAGGNLTRRLESGASVGVEAGYTREDSELTLSPLLPNPADSSRLDLSYRQPLGQGTDNPGYRQGLASAAAGVQVASADERALYDGIARQASDLFFGAALTRARMVNAQRAIGRAERLKRYVENNVRLGIAEQKDRLQAEAQLRARQADLDGLVVAWRQQRIGLNRLMGREWENDFEPLLVQSPTAPPALPEVYEEAQRHSPELLRNRARLDLADAAIARARDARRDKLDVVLSLGNRTRRGDAAGGSVDDSDVVGGVRLEYSRALDARGLDAGLYQAQLDRDVALQEIRLAQDDLYYNVASLVAEIEAAAVALASQERSVAAERSKLDEASERYRAGRTETDRLIQFEADLYAAELAVEQQRVELARRHTELSRVRGRLWRAQAGDAPDGVQ